MNFQQRRAELADALSEVASLDPDWDIVPIGDTNQFKLCYLGKEEARIWKVEWCTDRVHFHVENRGGIPITPFVASIDADSLSDSQERSVLCEAIIHRLNEELGITDSHDH